VERHAVLEPASDQVPVRRFDRRIVEIDAVDVSPRIGPRNGHRGEALPTGDIGHLRRWLGL
jgi:hypothetical protein